ncbi:hypothetical protein GCM10009616_31350 [Microlunatus lacustris]
MTSSSHHAPPISALIAGAAVVVALTGCTTAPAVGPLPGGTVSAPAPGFSSPPAEGLKIEINIDQQTVSPLEKEYEVERGRSVVLVTRSDHDTTLIVTGAGVDQTDFIDRLTTISTTFVADEPGLVLIRSTDPAATIARLTVS